MENMCSELVGLATAQVWLYRMNSKSALRSVGVHTLFYFFLLAFVQGLQIFCSLFAVEFYMIPLLSITLFFVFGGRIATGGGSAFSPKGFPVFQRASAWVPDFYLFTGLWVSLMWNAQAVPTGPADFAKGYFWSFFAAGLLPIFSEMKERLALLNAPAGFQGLPLFMIAAGIFLLGLLSFVR